MLLRLVLSRSLRTVQSICTNNSSVRTAALTPEPRLRNVAAPEAPPVGWAFRRTLQPAEPGSLAGGVVSLKLFDGPAPPETTAGGVTKTLVSGPQHAKEKGAGPRTTSAICPITG